METYDEMYNAFLKALKHCIEKEGYGSQSVFAANAGISSALLSQITRQAKKKQASLKVQIALAIACGYDYADFIDLGRRLLTGEPEQEVSSISVVSEVIEQTVSTSDYVEELKQQVKDLRSERDGLRADKAYLIAQTEEWKEERAEFKKEIAELKERIRSLEAQLSMTAELDVKKIAG